MGVEIPKKYRSASELAYYEIKKMIFSRKLLPEQPVREEKLAAELNISRTPLREALSRLEYEKLVLRRLNGRLKIAPVSAKEAKEIFQVRAMLESVVVEEATENATEQDLNYLSSIVYMLDKVYDDQDVESILKYGWKFHSYIYDLSNNITVKNILYQLNDHIYRYRCLVPCQEVELERENGVGHGAILQAMKDKNQLLAKELMGKHIESSLSSAINVICLYEETMKDIEK